MAIVNNCPLTGLSTTIDSIITVETNYLNHILSLPIKELNIISAASNMPRTDNLQETKLLFCAYAKQAKLLLNNRQLLDINEKVIVTHFNLVKSIATYLEKEPRFYDRIPKFAHYSYVKVDNFGHYLELIKKAKELYIQERKELKQKYKEQETILSEIEAIDIAETKLGVLASKYAARLKLTEETSSNFCVSKQLASYLLTAIKVPNDVVEWFDYLLTSPVSKLFNDSEVKEIDFIELLESIEDWETGLVIKYTLLSFLRKKLTAYNSYTGRKVSKLDISELDFLLGDIELVESKTVESTARSEAGQTTVKETTSETKSETTSETKSETTNTPSPDILATDILAPLNSNSNSNNNSNSTNNSNSNSTILAASILAKIAAKKKGN